MIPVSISIDGVEYDAVLAPPNTMPDYNCTICLLGHVCGRKCDAMCNLARTEPDELIHFE